MKISDLKPGMLIIRKSYHQKGPKCNVTNIGPKYITAVHPDHGVIHIFPETLPVWEQALPVS